MSELSDKNMTWITWAIGALLAVSTTLGGILYSSQQAQISKLEDKIYSQSIVAVTDEKLDRAMEGMTRYIDVRIQNIESSQREASRQQEVLISDIKEFRKEMREALAK